MRAVSDPRRFFRLAGCDCLYVGGTLFWSFCRASFFVSSAPFLSTDEHGHEIVRYAAILLQMSLIFGLTIIYVFD